MQCAVSISQSRIVWSVPHTALQDAVGMEGKGFDTTRMSSQRAHVPSSIGVPQADGLIVAATGKERAVWTENCRGNFFGMTT